MKLIPLTQGKFAQVDDENYIYINQWKWYAANIADKWYAQRGIINILTGKPTVVMMHRVLLNCLDKKLKIDHINSNGLDNQKSNIRICTHTDNMKNRRASFSSTSKYLGVSRSINKKKYVSKRTGEVKTYCTNLKWQVSIRVDKKLIYLGTFEDEIIAAEVYNKAAINHHGQFANLNKI
jgi:hypothetical protein